MDKQSLTYKTLKNVSYNFIGYFWPLIFSIIITPIIVFKLGTEKYGIYLVVMSVASLMGLFDLGLGATYIKYASEYVSKGEKEKIKRLTHTFNFFLLGLAVFCLLFFTVIGYFANTFFPTEVISSGHYFFIFFLAGLNFFVHNLGIYALTPIVMQRFDISTKIGMANMTVSNITLLLLVLFGYGLLAIFISQLIFTCILFFVNRHYSLKIMPEINLEYHWYKEEIFKVYKFSLTAYASNAANSALAYFDRLLIPFYLGPAALSYYSLPGNITAKTPSLMGNISSVVFPMISGLHSLDDSDKIKSIYIRIFKLINILTFAITISIVLFSNKMLLYWLNADFAEKSTGTLIVLAITYFFLSLGVILNGFLLGMGKTSLLLKMSVGMALINIVALIYLLPIWGIIGAAWAYLIAVLPIIYIFYYLENKIFHLSGRLKFYAKLYSKLSIIGVIFAGIVYYLILPFVSSLLMVVVTGPLSVILFLSLYKLFNFFEKDDFDLLVNFLKIIYLKFKGKFADANSNV